MRYSTLAALLFLAAACTPTSPNADASTPPSPSPVAPIAAAPGVAQACSAIKAAGCPEGSNAQACAYAVTKSQALDAGFARVDLKCLAAAKTPAQVRACGPSVTCPL